MKLSRLMLPVLLMALPSAARAQMNHPATQPTDAQRIFSALKSLAGTWVGPTATVPAMPTPTIGDSMRITLRVTSRGHVLVHEMGGLNVPQDEPTKYDHPVTMIYLDENEKLTLVHYCDAGNRPRMTARISADGKVVDFDFVDVSGAYDRTGHMQHAKFTIIDSNHHIEDWSYLMPNNMIGIGHFDLQRTPVVASSSR
jgi:hypothetical protein